MFETKRTLRLRLRPIAAAVASIGLWPLLPPTVALAQTAAAPGQEIVISAQKRTEKLKDTPVAASVVSEESLARSNASDISDLNLVVPSVQLKGTFNGRVPLAMRGISTNANEAAVGLTSGVSIMLDGVPVPSDSMAANELFDVVRVEVLKGPQSTLGGRTASSGVINIVTNSPSKTLLGAISLTGTSDKEYKLGARVSGPINEMLGFSVAAYGNEREYPIRNLMLGENSRSKASGGRIKLGLAVDKTLDITLMARAAQSDSTGGTFTYQYLTAGAALFPYFPFAPGGITQAQSFPGVNIRYGNTDYASPVRMSNKVRDEDVSLTVEKRFGGYIFSSVTAQQREKITSVQDVTAQAVYFLDVLRQGFIPDPPIGPPFFDNSQTIKITPKSLTQEFKIASPLEGDVSYVAGLFYSDVDVTQDHYRQMFVNPKIDFVDSKTQTTGLYGRVTWKLGSDMSLLTGLRYNRDKVSYSITDTGRSFSSAGSDSSSNVVGDLTLRYKLGADHMVYGTYARGYKPRAFNTAATLNSNAALTPVEREDIDHFEVGSKSVWLGGTATLNVALFNTTYQNFQVQFYPPGQVIPSLELANAAKARTRGLELDSAFNLAKSSRINFSAAYIDARFLDFNKAPAYPTQTAAQGAFLVGLDANGAPIFGQDASGKPMPDSPKVKFTLGADQQVLGDDAPFRLNFNAQYAYRTSALMQGNQNPETRQPGFGILNLSLTAAASAGTWSLTAFVNNALNKFYLVNAEDFFSGLYAVPGSPPGAANAVIGQPARDAKRYVGLRLNYYFE